MSRKFKNYGAMFVTLGLLTGNVPGQDTNQVHPVDLPTVLRLAGAQNLEIQMARERLREAEAQRSSALERFFPWIAPGVTYHRRDGVAQAVPAGIISDAHFQSYSPGISLAAQLDIGDAWYQSLAAKQLARASTHALEAQRQQTILEAAQLYFDLTRSKALVGVAADALQASEDYRRQLHEAVVAGLAFKGDELRVQTQKKDYEIMLRRAREQLKVSGVELARVLHLASTIELAPQDSGLASLTLVETNATAVRLINQALVSRPELKQGDAVLAAARENHNGAVYGPLIPSLTAQAFGGGLGGGPDGGPTHFGAEGDYLVGLTWRIGPGGLFDPGRVRTHQARVAQAELSETKMRDDISAQVVTALTRVQSLADQIELSQGKLTAATETLRVTHERKQYGVGIVLEDLQAQQDMERARADYLNAVAEFNKAQYQLAKYVGAL